MTAADFVKGGGKRKSAMRFGLCCIFRQEPITFRQVTAKTLRTLNHNQQLKHLSEICLHNVHSLEKALHYVAAKGIGAFRILSPLFPRYTHPEVGYRLKDLPNRDEILGLLRRIRLFRKQKNLRLSFHPDQFNVLSSPHPHVIANTMRELAYQGELAERVDAEVINIHGGGVYGNKAEALARLRRNIEKLPQIVRHRISLENDDVSFSPADLLPLCESMHIPLAYDVHHHRCLPDGLTEKEVSDRVVALWQSLGREPYFHLSSPKNGWRDGSPKPHADYIDPADFPEHWRDLPVTVDIEAKAKELAVLRLMRDLEITPWN